MRTKQGKMQIRDYMTDFEALLMKLSDYNEQWIINASIRELQPHLAVSVEVQAPVSV